LGRAQLSTAEVDATLIGLVERVTRRLRGAGRLCRTVVLRLRFDDFSRATRSHTLPRATSDTDQILTALRVLLVAASPTIEQAGLTLLGISLSNLDDGHTMQLELPFEIGSPVGLDSALDGIRDKYGSSAITRAVLLGRDPGLVMPLLPD
jgi:DNA polymerase-4